MFCKELSACGVDPFNGGNYWHCTNVSFRDEFVCNPDPIPNDETPIFSYPPSQPQTSSFNQFYCFGYGDPLEEGVHCKRCTCKWCGYGLREGFCCFCDSRDENPSINVPNLNSFNDPPNVFTHPPQHQYEPNLYELCGNDSHYGYDCPPGHREQVFYDSNLDEPAVLVTPLSDANEDECFDLEGDFDEIDSLLDIDTSTDIKDGYHDSKGDIIYLESLLTNDTIPSLSSEVFLKHDPKRLKDESDIDDLKNMVKVFDLGIHGKKISPTYVSLPFKDCHYLFLTYVISIFLPYFTYLVNSPFLLSSGSEDTIFDPDISAFHFSSLEPVASHQSGTFLCFNVYPNILNESSMEICSSTRFNPNITMI
nr:hypothetical protein [Tanacetum cinerariifolium]